MPILDGDDLAPEAFGPFLLIEAIGKGATGIVYAARSTERGGLMAVKRLQLHAERNEVVLSRFYHELALAQRLAHPHLVQTYEGGQIDGRPYVASELIQGIDLHVLVERFPHGAPVGIAIRVLVDLLAGLAYVHGAVDSSGKPLNLFHRDVSPGNVLISFEGEVKLADFGSAKSILSGPRPLTDVGTVLGTPRYIAPERVHLYQDSPAADLYSVGAVIYRVLAGRGPYEGAPAEIVKAIMHEAPEPLEVRRPDIPSWLVDVVAGLMQRNPSRRQANAHATGKAIESRAFEEGVIPDRLTFAEWMQATFQSEQEDWSAASKRWQTMDLQQGRDARWTEMFRVPASGPVVSSTDTHPLSPHEHELETIFDVRLADRIKAPRKWGSAVRRTSSPSTPSPDRDPLGPSTVIDRQPVTQIDLELQLASAKRNVTQAVEETLEEAVEHTRKLKLD